MITSLENEQIKYLKKLKIKKHRDQDDYFLVEGIDLVNEAYKAGYLKELFALTNQDFDIKRTLISEKIARALSSCKTSDYIFGMCFKKKEKDIGNRILYLDNVQDPGNVGTIIRTALAFDIDTVVLRNGCDLYNDKLIRATKGAVFHINIVIDNQIELLKRLKKTHRIIGTKINAKDIEKTIVKDSKFVIIMGNEGSGISKETEKLCDEFISILINPLCESLNVAIATGIILYQLRR